MIPSPDDSRDSDRKEDAGSPIRSRTGSKEISAEDFGYAKDKMAVRDCLEHFLAEPFSEFNHPLLMAGWAEMPALT